MSGLEASLWRLDGTRARLSALLVVVCATAPAYAQHDHRGGPAPQQRGSGWKGQQAAPPPPPPQAQQHGQGWRGAPQGPPPQQQRQQQQQHGQGWRGAPQGPPPQAQQPPRGGWRGPPQGAYAPQQRGPREARAWHQQGGWQRQGGGWQPHQNWQEHRAHNWHGEHRSWGQRGGYGGYYIPQTRFYSRFGSEHPFHLRQRPVIYQGYPRFWYGGSSFLIVDPWPEFWGENWYYTDDLYIGFDDGYYLYNRRDPSIALAITVVP